MSKGGGAGFWGGHDTHDSARSIPPEPRGLPPRQEEVLGAQGGEAGDRWQPSQAWWGNSLSTAGSEHSADLLGLLGQVPAVQAYPDSPVAQLVQGQRHGAEVWQAAPGTGEEKVNVPCLVGQGPRADPAAGPSPASGNSKARECCQGETSLLQRHQARRDAPPTPPRPRWTDLAFSPPDAVCVQQPLEVMREGDGVGHEGGQLAPVRFLGGGLQQLTHPLQQ